MSKQKKKARKMAQRKKVQSRFKSRVAAGKSGLTGGKKGTGAAGKPGSTISNYRAAQRKQVQDAARARNATFQANRKLTAAGGTSAQVAKDNQMYGNTVPAGSFNISEAGKAQAAANLAARTAPSGAFGISEAGRKQAAAQLQEKRTYDRAFSNLQARDPGMAKYISSLPANIRTDALIGGQTRAAGVELGIGAGTLIAGKALLGGGLFKAATPGLGYKGTQVGFTGMGKTGFDAIRSGAKYIASKKPQILGRGAYSAPTFKGAMRYAGKSGSLGGAQTPGGVIKSIVSGRAPRIGFLESQAKVSPAMFDKGVQLANKISQGAYRKSALANTFRNQMATGIAPGGGFGAGAGNVFTAAGLGAAGTAAVKSGGLNIGSTDGVDSGEPSGSGTGRVIKNVAKVAARFNPLSAIDFATNDRTDLDRMGNLKIGGQEFKPSDLVSDAGMVAGKIRNNQLSIGDLKSGYRDVKSIVKSKDKLNTIANMPTKDLERLATKGYDLAQDSAMVQRLGENQGLPKDFKQQTDTFRDAVKDRLSSVKIGDRDSTYKAISDFNRDIGTDPKLSLAARQVESFRSGEGTTMQKIAAGFQPGAAKVQGLSAAERGIVGSLGNRIISGKQTDIAREAMSEMKAGSSLTAGNLTGISQNVIKNTAPGADTVSAKRASQIKSIVTGGRGGGDITPSSLIRGVNPFRRSGSGTRQQIQGGGGGGGTTTPVGQLPQVPNPAQVELPVIPQQQEQQGTQASTLAGIQNQSYENTFNNLMAQFRPRRMGRRRSFRTSFNRDYFSQFV